MKTENHFTNNQDNFSPGGSSLEKDFKKLINDKRFHDFAIKCSDGKTVSL